MTAEIVESRLRRLLLIIVILIFIGTLIELSLQEHFEGLIQKIPAYLSLRGALGVLWVYLRPNRWSIYTLRVIMLVLGLDGIYGIYQHFTNNLAFELQIRPHVTTREVLLDTVLGGHPLLAPGIISLAGLLALVATYQYPAITHRSQPE